MATTILKSIIQFRRDTTENWILYKDIIPAAGEPCFDLNKRTLKIGDGVTTYENLPVIGGATVSADGKSIVFESGVVKMFGFDSAEVGAQPRKKADGTIEWVLPSTNGNQGNALEGVMVGGTLLDIIDKKVNIPIATKDKLGVIMGSDEITVSSSGALGVGSINVSKLVQDNDTILVLNSGDANII